jgi:hypothetical protein
MLRKCRMLRFLVRVLSAATRVPIPRPAGARGALASASAVSTGGTADAAAGASSGRVGVIAFPLTLYALRCVVRVLIRTLAFCRAEAAAAQPSATEAPSHGRHVPAAAAAAAAGAPLSVPTGGSTTVAERGAATATDAAAAPPTLSGAEAAELRACCLRIIAGAPLGRYSNPQEREEALELCDDVGVLLLDLQLHERQSEQAAERAAAAFAQAEAAAATAASVAAPGSAAAAVRMPRR